MKKIVMFIVCMFLLAIVVNDVSAKNRHHRQPTEAVPGIPVIDCQDLMGIFSYPSTTITDVAFSDDGEEVDLGRGLKVPMPAHCIVKGYMNERTGPIDGKDYAIGFEMRLPIDWNGRYFYQANGGVDGNIATAVGNIPGGGYGLAKGFAVISSDAGHPTRSAAFGVDPQARLDYGYNAVAELTPMAKNIIDTYYGKFPDKSYIVGSSNGGRHAMVAASRYADEYDGFLAGAPGFNLPQAAVAQLWGVQQYANISDYATIWDSTRTPTYSVERPDISTSFSPEETALVSDEILEECDLVDGVDDDWVGDPFACQEVFNINEDIPTCEDPDDPDCLTYGQKSVLARVHRGAMDSSGEALYTNFIWDPGITSGSWRNWKFSSSITNRDPVAVGFIFTTPPQDPAVLIENDAISTLDYALNWNGLGFDVDRDAPKIYATNDTYTEAAMSFMTPPDPLMKQLHAKGGRLIVVHGSADPVFSVADTVNWYEALRARYKKHTKKFARLFIVPGMSHSRGGPACDQYELFDALVDWVEQGIEPDAVESRVDPGNSEVPDTWDPERTRPLCAYPAVPVYNGSGDPEDASCWSCVNP